MKSRTLFFALLVIALGMLALWAFRHNRLPPITSKTTEAVTKSNAGGAEPLAASTPQNESPHEQQGTTAARHLATQSIDILREFEKTPANLSLEERLKELARRGFSLNVLTQQTLAQASNMVQEMRQTVNSPIEFYGKVVDENDLPVQGATVELSCVVYPEDEFRTNVLTGTNGMFALNNVTGATLFVNVGMEGYAQGTNQNRFTYTGLPAFESERFHPNPNNPVIFQLRKKRLQQE